jgi:Ca-activated chloride channel homolog
MIALNLTGRVIALTLLASATVQWPGAPPAPPDHTRDYVISREVDLIVLPVTVTNKQGQFVSGLVASNFHVYENGRLQPISHFESEDLPVAVGVIVDHSGSMIARRNEVIAGAMAFVEASNPQNEEFVINFADRPILALPENVSFTSDVNELKAALLGPYARGRTALNDAVIAALQHVSMHQASKRVLILISDGGDNASRHTFAQALRMAQTDNIAVYAVGLLDQDSADQNPKALQVLARETGGLAYFPSTTDDVLRVCRQIAQDIRHQYTIAYIPADDRHGEYRKIRVNVVAANRGKLQVRTRAGYYWNSKKAADTSTVGPSHDNQQ